MLLIPLKKKKDSPKAVKILRSVGYRGEIRGRDSIREKISRNGSKVVSTYELIVFVEKRATITKIIRALAENNISGTSEDMQIFSIAEKHRKIVLL